MKIGVLKERSLNESRVALTPQVIPNLTNIGYSVAFERNSGALAGYSDAEFTERGAVVAEGDEIIESSEILVQVTTPHRWDDQGLVGRLRPNQLLIGLADPLGAPSTLNSLCERGVSLLALELVPRTTLAQSMDVLSSMATVAGYKAVLLGAAKLPKLLPMMMTAAGTIAPARVLVLGAGVAGLQAIATARRLGAKVTGYDIRAEVREQVESLGADFLELELETESREDTGGYAQARDESFYARQQEVLVNSLPKFDLVVTTAAVPGKRAPVLITSEMLDQAKAGSIIVDLAAEQGGNCEATKAGEMVEHGSVKVLGPVNIASSVPYHASQMFARNMANLLSHLKKCEDPNNLGADEILGEMLVLKAGEVVHPKVLELLQNSTV